MLDALLTVSPASHCASLVRVIISVNVFFVNTVNTKIPFFLIDPPRVLQLAIDRPIGSELDRSLGRVGGYLPTYKRHGVRKKTRR
jgi:hypothetical protein